MLTRVPSDFVIEGYFTIGIVTSLTSKLALHTVYN